MIQNLKVLNNMSNKLKILLNLLHVILCLICSFHVFLIVHNAFFPQLTQLNSVEKSFDNISFPLTFHVCVKSKEDRFHKYGYFGPKIIK